MTRQIQFFEGADSEPALQLLEGFRYRPALIEPADEDALVARLRDLPFREFEFHGYLGKRRVVSFGWQYDYSGRQLRKADDIPEFLLGVRALAASFASLEAGALQHVLITEYGPGAGIGWHRDKAVFGQVVGISLLGPCVLRFRREKVSTPSRSDRINPAMRLYERAHSRQQAPNVKAASERIKLKKQWERANVLAEPRSAYLLSGPSRLEWQHSILRVDDPRYSITFRNFREVE